MKNHNSELQKYHGEKDKAAVTRGRQTYAAAEKEAIKWQDHFGSFDWTSTDTPEAASAFLKDQGKLA